ncbi:MAG: DMT family transporter [Chloroflexi bacterium]|nr:MAG: DMT family transporter [Chloroflexota bacterium]
MAARVTDRPSANPFVALADRPVRAAVLGALSIAFSAVLVRLSGASPATAAIFRCLYALPFLAVLAWSERRAYGPRPAAQVRLAWLAGIFFAIDLVVWHHTIEYVGAGLATVLGNTQVVIVALLAWWLLGERPSNRVLAAMPIVLLGVVLISGVIGSGAYGSNPGLGVVTGVVTGVSYAGFLMALRRGNADLRRPAGPLFDATWVAALAAVASQVVGWLLISVSLPRLPAVLTSVILTIQPVASVLLGILLVNERPSVVQLLGAGTILAGLMLATLRRRPNADPIAEPELG